MERWKWRGRRKSPTPQIATHISQTSHPPSPAHSGPQTNVNPTSTPKLKLNALVTRPLARVCRTSDDVAFTALQVLRDSSDAFPPLKSAVGGILSLWQTAKSIKSLKKDAESFSDHVLCLAASLEDALSDTDPTVLPKDVEQTLNALTSLLLDCQEQLGKDARRSRLGRLAAYNRTKDTWADFRVRFSQECERFSMQATAITVARVARLQEQSDSLLLQNAQLLGDIDEVKNRVVLIHQWTTDFKIACVCFF